MTAPRFKVLVADDHADHLEMISRAVRRSRTGPYIDLVTAMDGDSAYRIILDGIDLAFLDIKMPGRSGLEVLQVIREEHGLDKLPVAIVSSSSDPWDTQTSTRFGAVAHIEKGRYSEFRARVQGVVEEVLGGRPAPDRAHGPEHEVDARPTATSTTPSAARPETTASAREDA